MSTLDIHRNVLSSVVLAKLILTRLFHRSLVRSCLDSTLGRPGALKVANCAPPVKGVKGGQSFQSQSLGPTGKTSKHQSL